MIWYIVMRYVMVWYVEGMFGLCYVTVMIYDMLWYVNWHVQRYDKLWYSICPWHMYKVVVLIFLDLG